MTSLFTSAVLLLLSLGATNAATLPTLPSLPSLNSLGSLGAFEAALSNGITGPLSATLSAVTSLSINSVNNFNPRQPVAAVYPRKASGDAPYSLSESVLRSAIYIPSSFSYGSSGKQPVILVPGTGAPGGTTYANNFAKLLAGTTFADPLWINIPGNSLGDVQVNSEFVAYAINYISGITGGQNVSVVGWSQGNVNSQWALKYWPSTRQVVSDLISISPDFHGSVISGLPCVVACAPSLLQQEYSSNFIGALRSNGGDSAYVPTTVVYSATDEFVQPQIDPFASATLLDARGVGVSNTEVQEVCLAQTAGGIYTHEGMLSNPISYALAVDALTHPGPGDFSRIDASLCADLAAPGLNSADVLATEVVIDIVILNIIVYPMKVTAEPAVTAYAS
jgi:hypothetical protein